MESLDHVLAFQDESRHVYVTVFPVLTDLLIWKENFSITGKGYFWFAYWFVDCHLLLLPVPWSWGRKFSETESRYIRLRWTALETSFWVQGPYLRLLLSVYLCAFLIESQLALINFSFSQRSFSLNHVSAIQIASTTSLEELWMEDLMMDMWKKNILWNTWDLIKTRFSYVEWKTWRKLLRKYRWVINLSEVIFHNPQFSKRNRRLSVSPLIDTSQTKTAKIPYTREKENRGNCYEEIFYFAKIFCASEGKLLIAILRNVYYSAWSEFFLDFQIFSRGKLNRFLTLRDFLSARIES